MPAESLRHVRLAFLGAGSVTSNLVERLVSSSAVPADNILVTDPAAHKLQELRRQFGIVISPHDSEAARFADILFLGVPAAPVTAILEQLRGCLSPKQLIVSLSMGVPTNSIEEAIGIAIPVARVVPTAASLIGCGVNPYCLGKHVNPLDQARLVTVLATFGQCVKIAEEQMDSMCALVSTGQIYILPLMNAFTEAAVRAGIAEREARFLVAKVVLGTAELVRQTEEDLASGKLNFGLNRAEEERVRAMFGTAVREVLNRVSEAAKKTVASAA